MSIAAILLAAPTLPFAPASAQFASTPLNQSQIATRLFGKRLIGEYADGQSWAENFNTDGTSDYVQDGRLSVGRMFFDLDLLCFSYQPQELTGGCFEVWQRGTNCFDFYARTSIIASRTDRQFGRNWDARAWIEGVEATCQAGLIS
ncbi:MAG: hypothetical protein OXR62_01530 [Ahrensia sp.]|nr:hypothetical protein [Ahrensia sp.]